MQEQNIKQLEENIVCKNEQMENAASMIANLNIENDNLLKRQNKLLRAKQSLSDQLKNVHSKLKTQNHLDNEIQSLKKELTIALQETEKYKFKYQDSQRCLLNYKNNNFPVNDALDTIINRLNDDNYSEHKELIERLYRKSVKLRELNFDKKFNNESNITIFGHVVYENDEPYLLTIDNQFYPVTGFRGKYLYEGDPVKANLDLATKTAYIFWNYFKNTQDLDFIEDTYINEQKVKKMKVMPAEENIQPLGNYKILVVGGVNMDIANRKLQKYGLAVEWFNPFEESPHILKNKRNRADVIILLQDFINHVATNIISLEDENVEVIEGKSVDRMVARIRYSLIKRNN